MDLQLEEKVILITGGSNGIGAAIARGCAREGAIAVIVDKDAAAGNQLQSELKTQGLPCGFICLDLLSTENCYQAIHRTLKEFGGLDSLVNNAGINDRVGLEAGNPEQFIASLQRNLFHYYNMVHYALPALKKSKGSIVNIASKTALTGQGGTSGYVAAKGAILALTREWAVEFLPYEIRVNAVLPAEVMTALYKQWLATFPNPEEKLNQIVSKIPLGKRMTSADEIAATVLFLLSGHAGHTTGQLLFVDGGYVHLDRSLT
jgi:NAD(P)-dependent dehydrogenase (short-subunit alcohol dehydrogenase family)